MLRLITIAFFCFIYFSGLSQTFERKYFTLFPNSPMSIQDLEFRPDTGGIVVCFENTSPPLNTVLRFDKNGDSLWSKRIKFDSIGFYAYPLATGQLANGNYLLGGTLTDTTFAWNSKYFVMQMDPAGNPLSTIYYTPYGHYNLVMDLIPTKEDGFYVGNVDDSTITGTTYWRYDLRKYSSTGNYLWRKRFQCSSGSPAIKRLVTNSNDELFYFCYNPCRLVRILYILKK
jgi:hypothetical protein